MDQRFPCELFSFTYLVTNGSAFALVPPVAAMVAGLPLLQPRRYGCAVPHKPRHPTRTLRLVVSTGAVVFLGAPSCFPYDQCTQLRAGSPCAVRCKFLSARPGEYKPSNFLVMTSDRQTIACLHRYVAKRILCNLFW